MPNDSEPRYSHILTAVANMPWAILPAKMEVILELLALRATGAHLTASEVRDRIGAAASSPARSSAGSVAVIPLHGTLIPRADLMTEMSGATSLERWTASFQSAVTDPNISAIIIDVDSPGGSVFGVEEAGNAVFNARGSKPITAVANTLAASAAYWIATQADELVVSPSAEVGSIGVFGAHQDLSVALEKAGVTVSLISAGKFKTEGSPFAPLSDEARAAMQARVDDYYAAFVKAVARGRGRTSQAVRDGFGQGRVEGATSAVKLSMADSVGTLDDVIRRVASGKSFGSGRKAMASATATFNGQTVPVAYTWGDNSQGTLGIGTSTTITFGALQQQPEPTAEKLAIIEPEAQAALVEPVSAGPSLDLRRRRLRRRAIA